MEATRLGENPRVVLVRRLVLGLLLGGIKLLVLVVRHRKDVIEQHLRVIQVDRRIEALIRRLFSCLN